MNKRTRLLALFLVVGMFCSLTIPVFADEKKEYKDTLIWGQGADVTSFDPHIGKETPAVEVTDQIFDTLTMLDEKGEVHPQIAESWKAVSDTEYEFKIRDNVKFHDGSVVTPEDVKFSLERAIASNYVSYIVDFIKSVEVKDEHTVTITTKVPYAPILRNLAVPFAAIVPKAYVEKVGDEEFAKKPIGSGPYKFVSWQKGSNVKMEAFEDYFMGAPATAKLEMRVIPEAAQRTIALETGEIDIAYDIQANDVNKIRDNDALAMYEDNGLTCWYLSFNTKKTPFDNQLVRQAIRHAIDIPTIILALLYGAGKPAGDLIAPGVFGYPGTEPYTYDVEKAKELLKEAGYENGFECTLWVNDNQSRVEICQAIADMLKKVNITCKVEIVEFGSFIQKTSNGEHDFAYFGWTTSSADADYSYYSLIHSSQQGAPGNRSFFDNKDADALIEKGRTTTDPDERVKIYKDLEAILYDESPNDPLYYGNINAGASKKVENFILDPNGYHKLEGVKVLK